MCDNYRIPHGSGFVYPILPQIKLYVFWRILEDRLPQLSLICIKTISRLEGAAPSNAGRPLWRGGSGPPPGPPPRLALPAPAPLPASLGVALWLRPDLRPRITKQRFCSKQVLNKIGVVVLFGLAWVGPSLRVPGRASPSAPAPVAAGPSRRVPASPAAWFRVLLLGLASALRSPPAATPPCGGLPPNPAAGNWDPISDGSSFAYPAL